MKYTGLILLVVASIIGTAMANNTTLGWNNQWNNTGYNYSGWGPHQHGYNVTQSHKRVIVGGSNNWQFGYDYMAWARNTGPFYVNDTLVFKYDPPNDTNTHPHSVYLFSNMRSFTSCDLKKAKMVANWSDGAGEGFEFVLTKWKPYYFACGESGGIHCKIGKMKFFVTPLLRHWRN